MMNSKEKNLIERLGIKDSDAAFDALDHLDAVIKERKGISQDLADRLASLPAMMIDEYVEQNNPYISLLMNKYVNASEGPAVLARTNALKSIVCGLAALPEGYYHNQGMLASWDDILGTTTGDSGELFVDPFIGAEPAPEQPEQPKQSKIEVYHAPPYTATQNPHSAGDGNNRGRLPPPVPLDLNLSSNGKKPFFDSKEPNDKAIYN